MYLCFIGDTTNQAPTLDDVEKSIAAGFMAPIVLADPSKDNGAYSVGDMAETADVFVSDVLDTPPETPVSGQTETDDDRKSPRKSPQKVDSLVKLTEKTNISPPKIIPAISPQKSNVPTNSPKKAVDAELGEALQIPSTVQHLNKVLGAGGDAEPQGKLLPKSITDQYRIVCQCGAKNCRKYLF